MKRRRYIFWMRVVRFAAKRADRTGIDWIDDDALSREDVEARLSVLPKAGVITTGARVVIKGSPFIVTEPRTWGSGDGTTWTLRP